MWRSRRHGGHVANGKHVGHADPTHEPATCDEPEASTIELVASSALFNVTCLVVPSGEPLDVTLRNEDGVNHNFSIYTLEFASAFTGEISFGGETFHYDVPALEPGEYLFQCDIHPRDMEGPRCSMTGVRLAS